eukprot:1161257-Pelagomonas_calceolata.AAC.6
MAGHSLQDLQEVCTQCVTSAQCALRHTTSIAASGPCRCLWPGHGWPQSPGPARGVHTLQCVTSAQCALRGTTSTAAQLPATEGHKPRWLFFTRHLEWACCLFSPLLLLFLFTGPMVLLGCKRWICALADKLAPTGHYFLVPLLSLGPKALVLTGNGGKEDQQ